MYIYDIRHLTPSCTIVANKLIRGTSVKMLYARQAFCLQNLSGRLINKIKYKVREH